MNCPDCKSEDVSYLNPKEWKNQSEKFRYLGDSFSPILTIDKTNKGGFRCKKCNAYFSYNEGIMQ